MNYFHSHGCLANFQRVTEKLALTLNQNLQFQPYSLSHTFDRFLWSDDRGVFASLLTKDSLEVADGISVFGVDPVGQFCLYLLLKHSSSKFSTDDFLSRHSTRLKQDLQIRQDCLLTSIVWRINREIFSARPTWLSKL